MAPNSVGFYSFRIWSRQSWWHTFATWQEDDKKPWYPTVGDWGLIYTSGRCNDKNPQWIDITQGVVPLPRSGIWRVGKLGFLKLQNGKRDNSRYYLKTKILIPSLKLRIRTWIFDAWNTNLISFWGNFGLFSGGENVSFKEGNNHPVNHNDAS